MVLVDDMRSSLAAMCAVNESITRLHLKFPASAKLAEEIKALQWYAQSYFISVYTCILYQLN